ncbi:MAG: transcriptional regulator [Rhodococcus sp. (in: high G+C Gram-positive bacteria)]|uniref:transcriptional regulator n=1 Tax=Nocardiaceae TaxID=85025 RepID=UPI00095ABFBE|nr:MULTISPECIES: transcriptional regulator [Rhodococcus]MCC8930396.1 transcriptional regulator [Rhodococcus sp. I2R]MCZ4277813.1 transcriptional regulator [Rhodococcus yunnanensis]OLT33256.1 transcriptional regulator [Rhodococcus sp. CUA-806]
MAHSRSGRRPALIALVMLSAAACLALGWWQWERFEAVGGNGQNLGYALQWPLFAAFVIYAYRKFVKLEDEAESPDAPESEAENVLREIPADLLPARPAPGSVDDRVSAEEADLETRQLLEYNSYLAELDRSRE